MMTDDVTDDEAKKLMRSLQLLQTMQRNLQTIQRALHPTQEDIEIAKAIAEAKAWFGHGVASPLAPPLHPVDAPPVHSTMHPIMHPASTTRRGDAPPVHPAPPESNAPSLPKRESPRHARLPDGTYRCNLCGHTAETRNSIKSHYRRKHRGL